jgi:hypothetical protein
MLNEFEWDRDQDQCTKPLEKYDGAAKEMIRRLRETLLASVILNLDSECEPHRSCGI